jgi:3-deoxy-7-phosphoheptulonate synthase
MVMTTNVDSSAAIRPYTLAWRERVRATIVTLGAGPNVTPCVVGGEALAVIAGPSVIEGAAMLTRTARAARAGGAGALRGGVFAAPGSPYAFQGVGAAGLAMLAEARVETGLPVVTEIVDARQVASIVAVADCIQIGGHSMQNYALLAAVGETTTPVLLERGMSATVRELLLAAEHVLSRGNERVMLCERGIRTFEAGDTLDLATVAVLKRETHLPVVVDPSHSASEAGMVIPLALAGVAAGADGLLVAVHPSPSAARSGGAQSLGLDEFGALMRAVGRVALAVGRRLGGEREVGGATGPVVRAILGEAIVDGEGAAAVARATRAMLEGLLARHRIGASAVVSAMFTVTPDLVNAFPAAVARDMGWTDVPLFCVAAVPVPGTPARRVQVMLHVNVGGVGD